MYLHEQQHSMKHHPWQKMNKNNNQLPALGWHRLNPEERKITRKYYLCQVCNKKEGRKINLPAQMILMPYWHP